MMAVEHGDYRYDFCLPTRPAIWIDGSYWLLYGRHGLAALCLHGQPFGFTREDVQDVQAAIREVRMNIGAKLYNPEDVPTIRALEDRLLALADRIAALLPPHIDGTASATTFDLGLPPTPEKPS